jgi:hypothetical protein
VVYVNGVKKPGWCAIVRLKHRNPFPMLEATNKGNEGEIDIDSHTHAKLRNWRRPLMEGISVDASVNEEYLLKPYLNQMIHSCRMKKMMTLTLMTDMLHLRIL